MSSVLFQIYCLFVAFYSNLNAVEKCIRADKKIIISERSRHSCMIFSQHLLKLNKISEEDFKLIEKIKNIFDEEFLKFLRQKNIEVSETIVYLKTNSSEMLRRLRARRRKEEGNIDESYFVSLSELYERYFVNEKIFAIETSDKSPNEVLTSFLNFLNKFLTI